jgi:hypothetical protein
MKQFPDTEIRSGGVFPFPVVQENIMANRTGMNVAWRWRCFFMV